MDRCTFYFLVGFFGLFTLYAKLAVCGRIYGMANHYYSHQSTLGKLGNELVSRGHNYTQIIPYFLAEKFRDLNLEVFNTSLTNEEIEDVMMKVSKAGDVFSLTGMYKMMQLVDQGRMQATQLCKDVLSNQTFIDKLRDADVFLCDITSTCCFILADMLNVSRVDVSSIGFASAAFAYYHFSLPVTPVYLTQETITDPKDPGKFSFKRRLLSFIYYIILREVFVGMLSRDLWQQYAKPTSRYTDILNAWKAHNLVLISHDFALEYPRPMGPHVNVLGAVLPEPPKSLPEDLDSYMNKHEKVILVSFGSSNMGHTPELLQLIAQGLSKVSASILWKLNEGPSLNLSENIKLVSWIPQNDLLGHISTKVFVTHCGLNSILESAYHGVPVVGIPLFGDQHRQAALVQVKQIGVTLDKTTMKPEDLVNAIHEVLSNTLYRENAKRISEIMRDRKRTPTEEGADWIEYALRHNGAEHLISEALDLPEYQLYCLDILLFLFVTLAVGIFIFVKICACVCRKRMFTASDKIKQN